MEDLNVSILRDFGISPKKIIKYRGTYILKTKDGEKLVKKNGEKIEKIIKGQKIINILEKNNINTSDNYYLNSNKKPFSNFRGVNYIMIDYKPIITTDFDKDSNFLKIIEEIGRFHKALETTDIKIKDEKNISVAIQEDIKNIKLLKKRVNKFSRKSDFDIYFLKHFENYKNDLEKALEVFSSNYFKEKIKICFEKNSIVHNLLKEETIGFYNGDIYINCFEEITNGCQLSDLSNLIIRHIRNKKDEHLHINEILTAYKKYNSLSCDDIEIIKAFILYPKKYLKIINDYYSKKRNWVPTGFDKKIKIEIENRMEYIKFIENI